MDAPSDAVLASVPASPARRARPTFVLARRAFVALIGVVYLVAFGSFAVQVRGLIGSRGILPAAELLERARDAIGDRAHWRLPSVLWWSASDGMLTALCACGMVLAVLSILGVAPRIVLAIAWLGYLSLSSVADVFLGYQWDALLLEAGLLAVLFAPGGLRPRWNEVSFASRVGRWLLVWLLARFVFMSGLVKLASDDETWADFTALQFHYWTQPLPNAVSWYADALPAWWHKASCAVMFAIELGTPFLFLGPRVARCAGAILFLSLMALVTITGSYGFFTLLSVALTVVVLDDAVLERGWPRRWRALEEVRSDAPPLRVTTWKRAVVAVSAALAATFGALVLALTACSMAARFRWIDAVPEPIASIDRAVDPLRSFNTYGLFAVMTTERTEIEIEGSFDGNEWRAYAFRWKPGDPARAPGFAGLYMPRVDWQMWFAALGSWRQNPWYLRFVERLLQGSPEVVALLDENPFPDAPPRYVRSTAYRYRFSPRAERNERGAWWMRTHTGAYAPTFMLENGALAPTR